MRGETIAYLDIASVALFYAIEDEEYLGEDDSEWIFNVASKIDEIVDRLKKEAVV